MTCDAVDSEVGGRATDERSRRAACLAGECEQFRAEQVGTRRLIERGHGATEQEVGPDVAGSGIWCR